MTRRFGNVVVIEPEEDAKCELCGKLDELRPAGPKGERVCYDCAIKDPEAMDRYFDQLYRTQTLWRKMMSKNDPFDDREFKKWLQASEEEMLPQMKESALSVTLMTNKIDAKLCLEVGAAVLYDKPIVVVAVDGAPVPAILRRIASAIVDGNLKDEDTRERVQQAIEEVLATDKRVQ